ncbi:PDZ domain-containing protein [Trinickia terrae]|uniref:Probable periplasmic serine endoprotease DegP-like n=1 Tax=Trinickia terrae TaxID=2571161 RepID=A0A4V6WQE3_9BURK|nr:trypsin-like peptidase domain-containing protein [Trinickia terrae]TKC92290.1 PDZ domain-containing protein [Trinickia terrae]
MLHPTFARTFRRAAALAVFLGCCLSLQPIAIAAGAAPAPAKAVGIAPANAAALLDFPTIVERYGPAVVNISATDKEPQTSVPPPKGLAPNDPFSGFFKWAVPQASDAQGNPPRAISGTGSGFIVSPDGMILTTAHVVDGADQVTVRLTDQREFKAKVLAVDAQSDVAVIQIAATKLPTVKLGDSSRVRVGEPVVTIGAPYGFENTVTAGIVSATGRTLPDGSTFSFLQTDVSVNPDNSGGPVFNRAGEVVGIDVQIYADTERYQSLTFAIPINLANEVRARFQPQPNVAPGGLGIDVQDVGPGLSAALGLPRAAGVLVNSVGPGTPAAASGLRPGDVIVQIGDKTIDRSAELVAYVARLAPGTNTTIKLIRNRKAVTINVTFSGATENVEARQTEAGAGDRLGLTMHPLSEDERRTSGLPVGLMVDQVAGPAANAGIQPGDIVVSLNDTLVESQEQAASLETKAGKTIAVLIQRNNVRHFVSVKLK